MRWVSCSICSSLMIMGWFTPFRIIINFFAYFCFLPSYTIAALLSKLFVYSLILKLKQKDSSGKKGKKRREVRVEIEERIVDMKTSMWIQKLLNNCQTMMMMMLMLVIISVDHEEEQKMRGEDVRRKNSVDLLLFLFSSDVSSQSCEEMEVLLLFSSPDSLSVTFSLSLWDRLLVLKHKVQRGG